MTSFTTWRPSDARFLLILLLPLLVGAGVLRDPAVVALHSLIGFAVFALVDTYIGLVTGSQGITLAHELGHSRAKFDRVLAWVLMTSVGYAHFMVEHYRGHHVRVATEADPATARRGESLWRFLPRTLAGSWRSAWRLEAQGLQRFDLAWWRSPLVWTTVVCAVAVLSLFALGWHKIVAFVVMQAAVAVWLLEAVNYIEHYGLVRANRDGQREPFGVMHAWNADHVVANSLLANLQRHSDHHMHAWKPWATLEALPGPQLPGSYTVCITMAAFPAWWFSAIHPRLDALPAHALQKDAT